MSGFNMSSVKLYVVWFLIFTFPYCTLAFSDIGFVVTTSVFTLSWLANVIFSEFCILSPFELSLIACSFDWLLFETTDVSPVSFVFSFSTSSIPFILLISVFKNSYK